jgi:hypothetical protein
MRYHLWAYVTLSDEAHGQPMFHRCKYSEGRRDKMESMSAYELERLANIKRNAELLESLGVEKKRSREATASARRSAQDGQTGSNRKEKDAPYVVSPRTASALDMCITHSKNAHSFDGYPGRARS